MGDGGTVGLRERRRMKRGRGGGVLIEEQGMWVCRGFRRMPYLERAVLYVRITLYNYYNA